jgi:hypothetical protein
VADTAQSREEALYQFRTDRLASEYEIVQDKIDKIGAFRFTIRGWTVTLVTGAILAVASATFLSPYALLFLLILLGVFAAIERQQNRNQQVLEDRAFEIEVEFRRMQTDRSGSHNSLMMTPRIAHSLRDGSLQNINALRRFLEDPDRWFYWSLVFVVFAVVLFLLYLRPRKPSSDQEVHININNQSTSHASGGEPATTKAPVKRK